MVVYAWQERLSTPTIGSLFTLVRGRGILRSWSGSLGDPAVFGLDHHVSGLNQCGHPLAFLQTQLLRALAGDERHHLVAVHLQGHLRCRRAFHYLGDRAWQPITCAECHRGSSLLSVVRGQPRTIPRPGGPYSPECVEEEFSEVHC